jgi:dTDP-4-amino-4,6-dideoxygalactose transaminase
LKDNAATAHGKPAGSFGAAAALSFNGNKIITTSGGGAVLTDDARHARAIRKLAAHAREDVIHYEHLELGYNYRLSNLLAAFGRGQLQTLTERVARRRSINAEYRRALARIPGVSFMPEAHYGRSNCWLTALTVDEVTAGVSRDAIIRHLDRYNIEARPTWKPMHLQRVFRDAPRVVNGTAERIFQQGLCLPSGSSLTPEDQRRVIDALVEILQRPVSLARPHSPASS